MSYLTVGKRGSSCLKYQKRVVSSIFNCGPSKVWLDPTRAEEISRARTREALRELINDNAIKHIVRKRGPRPNPRTEILNRKYLICKKRDHRYRMKQKAEYHKERIKRKFPLSSHPSLQNIMEKEDIMEKEE